MAKSDSMYTTWSKLKQRSSEHLQLRRHPSGNNNTTQTDAATEDSNNINNSNTVKSLSLPNLFRQKQRLVLNFSFSYKKKIFIEIKRVTQRIFFFFNKESFFSWR